MIPHGMHMTTLIASNTTTIDRSTRRPLAHPPPTRQTPNPKPYTLASKHALGSVRVVDRILHQLHRLAVRILSKPNSDLTVRLPPPHARAGDNLLHLVERTAVVAFVGWMGLGEGAGSGVFVFLSCTLRGCLCAARGAPPPPLTPRNLKHHFKPTNPQPPPTNHPSQPHDSQRLSQIAELHHVALRLKPRVALLRRPVALSGPGALHKGVVLPLQRVGGPVVG